MDLEALRKTQFQVYNSLCEMQVSHYQQGGRTAIQLTVVGTGESYCTLTINMPEIDLAENEIIVKTYSENTLAAQEAYATGLFKNTGRTVPGLGAPIWYIK